MKSLLIGGAGFIGSHLAHALIGLGHEVTIIDNKSRSTGLPLPASCRVHSFDICDMILLGSLNAWDWCFHLAAVVGVPNVEQAPGRTATVASVSATWLNALKADRHFVASTSELYGGHCPITSEDAPVVIPDLTAPRAAYAVGKVWQETTAILSGQSYVIGRFHNVYGPAMGLDHVIPRFCQQLREPGDHVTVEDPAAIRAFCYIDDAVQGILAAMTLDRVIVNIGNPEEPITMRRLMERLQDVTGIERPITTGDLRGFPRARIPGIERLRSLTGWRPTIPLAVGLRATWEAYR
ncbi:MAG TPA: NAD-dependent epimerase/dehydratase family protein [Dehalococcoidia bacterium]|nr:NAD-dependent epimerase/dehydratase family protein [Dehalococcoidia bacterium]